MSETPEMYSEGNTSFSEFGADEVHRIHSSKNIKTLESVKINLQSHDLSTEKIRDFLHDTNASMSSDYLGNEDFSNPQRLEKMIYKQQFLEHNNLFNPTKYFGGVEVTDLDDPILDQKLDYMFMEYLTTEMEEKDESENKTVKQDSFLWNTGPKPQNTTLFKTTTKMPTPPSKIFSSSKPFTQHKKSSSIKHLNGSVDLKPLLETKRTNYQSKIVSNSERVNSIDKRNQFSNSKPIKSLNRDTSSFYDIIKPKELSIDFFNKSKNIISPGTALNSTLSTQSKQPVLRNIINNNLTAASFNTKLKFEKENIVSKSPGNIHIVKTHHTKNLSHSNKENISNYSTIQKKSSSFVTHMFEPAPSRSNSKFGFGMGIFSHPRTENPSFIENELNKSTENFSCARVLRTTNDTDKENQDPNYHNIKPSKSPSSTLVKKYQNSIFGKPKKQIESPFCHLKMPKSQNFFESKKKLNSTIQRLATQN